MDNVIDSSDSQLAGWPGARDDHGLCRPSNDARIYELGGSTEPDLHSLDRLAGPRESDKSRGYGSRIMSVAGLKDSLLERTGGGTPVWCWKADGLM